MAVTAYLRGCRALCPIHLLPRPPACLHLRLRLLHLGSLMKRMRTRSLKSCRNSNPRASMSLMHHLLLRTSMHPCPHRPASTLHRPHRLVSILHHPRRLALMHHRLHPPASILQNQRLPHWDRLRHPPRQVTRLGGTVQALQQGRVKGPRRPMRRMHLWLIRWLPSKISQPATNQNGLMRNQPIQRSRISTPPSTQRSKPSRVEYPPIPSPTKELRCHHRRPPRKPCHHYPRIFAPQPKSMPSQATNSTSL